MNKEMNWRFPASNHGDRKGISTGDDEAFKKNPYKSFAREIIQNSIDVPLNDDDPVCVEIKEFDINVSDIPGIESYKKALDNIIDFWQHKKEYVDEYKKIQSMLTQNTIPCLRISDYNTTGLTGIYSNEQKDNKWLALTQGAGVSEKSGEVSGGSKGIGKNAAFELSSLKMVIYSTMTTENEKGTMGVAKLISGYVDNDTSERRDHTQGTGYYANDEYNTPISDLADFDKSIPLRTSSGTDIYIIGFDKNESFEKETVNSVLDSFMAAIIRKDLNVKINGIEITHETVKDLVYSDIIFENNKANIVSQYTLLSGDDEIKVFDIETEYGTPKLFVWVVPKEKEEYATHECVMIRYPLMKIKTFPLNKSFNVSAMCVIENDKLGAQLLKIENPQHIDWETGRIKDKSLRTSIVKTIKDIRTQITNIVTDCLKLDDDEPLDPYGAGEYLPEDLGGDVGSNAEKKESEKVTEKITVGNRKEIKFQQRKTIHDAGEPQNGLVPDITSADDDNEDGDVYHPTGTNNKHGGDSHPGDTTSSSKEGDSVMFRRSVIYGAKYKWMAINKTEGHYKIRFVSPGDYDNCYLCISLVDDSNSRSEVNISKLSKNGNEVNGYDPKEYGPFSINANEKIDLDVYVDEKETFSSEVKIVCK